MLTSKATNGVIMDTSGIDAVIALRMQFPDARIIILRIEELSWEKVNV